MTVPTRRAAAQGCGPGEDFERFQSEQTIPRNRTMNSIIYIVGLVVIVVAILSFLGLG